MPHPALMMVIGQAPPVLPIDMTALVLGGLGIMVVLIPIAGLTVRFALKPIAEAVARMRESQGSNQQVAFLEQRLGLLEQQMSNMESDVRRIEETTDFDRRLHSGETD